MTASYVDLCQGLARQPRRWLVTGAAGFIGSALTERLLELGQQVVGLDNFATGSPDNLRDLTERVGERAKGFHFVEGDIRDPSCCALACRGADLVLHQAAQVSVPRSLEDPRTTHECNVDGFVNVVLAARDAGAVRVVYASSSAVYGDLPRVPHVESRVGAPLSPYALTKRIDELYAELFARSYGIELVGLRYFNVFGRRQDPDGAYAAVIPRWLRLLLGGQSCTLFGDGLSTRDYCPVDDVVQANLLAALSPAAGAARVYNVGSGVATSLQELHDRVRQAAVHEGAQAGGEPRYAPARPGDPVHSQADIQAIVAALGFRPTSGLATPLARTAKWFARPRACR